MKRLSSAARPLAGLAALFLLPTQGLTHEAWLLTPSEIEALSTAPVPTVFRSQLWLGLAAALALGATLVALRLEAFWSGAEQRLIAPIGRRLQDAGLLLVRFGVGVMLLLGAFGGLPRHGTALWSVPTFMVPDMQLLSGAMVLILLQILLGLSLCLGLFTRLAGLGLVGMSVLGLALFGLPFLSYAPHFAAPGIVLIAFGGGRFALDRLLGSDILNGAEQVQAVLLRVAQVLVGAGFVYLGVAYKLFQPTLLIAILEHGGMPSFGLPMAVIALVMTGVEIVCGALLVAGRLVRPVALAILGAISFLAIVLGETPLFHANLYGVLTFFLLTGAIEARAGFALSLRARRVA